MCKNNNSKQLSLRWGKGSTPFAWAQAIGVLSTFAVFLLVSALDYVTRDYAGRLTETAPAVWLAVVSALLIALNVTYNWRYIFGNRQQRNLRDRISLLVTNTCSGSPVDITLIGTFLLYTAQIPNAINEILIDGGAWWRPVLYFFGLMASVLLKPLFYSESQEVSTDERKVLITGLSSITYSLGNGGERSNLEAALSPIKLYPNIKRLHIIVTKFSYSRIPKEILPEQFQTYVSMSPQAIKEDKNAESFLRDYPCFRILLPYFGEKGDGPLTASELKTVVSAYIDYLCDDQTRSQSIKIVISDYVDFDDFDSCNRAIKKQVDDIFRIVEPEDDYTYQDRDFVFDISPGTKMLTGAMTINAIKGKRAIVYVSQNSKAADPAMKLREYNANVVNLYDQFSELILETSERNNI